LTIPRISQLTNPTQHIINHALANPEAMSFIPGKIMHTRKRLNPLAKPFVPGELWMVDEPGIHSQVFGEELAVFYDGRV
jgi:hypothetical protein